MNRIELWMLRRFVKKCRDRTGPCSEKCPYFLPGKVRLTPCRIGMPWNWQLEERK
jgi:hypothetical protein